MGLLLFPNVSSLLVAPNSKINSRPEDFALLLSRPRFILCGSHRNGEILRPRDQVGGHSVEQKRACLLRSVPRNEGAERPAFCVQQDALCCWVLEQLACEECGLRKPLAGFPRAALDRALRRISRACVPGDVLPRGRGNIRCIACAMGSTDSKSMVLQTIQTGRIRGRVRMTLELEVPGTVAGEGVLEDRFSEAWWVRPSSLSNIARS